MFIGTLIMAPKATAGVTTHFYSPWMPRQAQNAWFTYQLIQSLLGGGSFAIGVWTKNREDRGDEGTDVSPTWTHLNSTGIYEAKCEGLKELVRFKFTITSGGAAFPEGVVYRMLAAMWYDKIV